MLIVHRLSADGYRYYIGAVGPDAGPEPALGEAPGQWLGAAAASLGLTGRVDAATLRRVLPRGQGRVPGFDLTFAAPKSVSVLHGLGEPAVVDAVRGAHEAAVIAGLAYVERHATAVRVAGRVHDAEGIVVAAFRHRVSRADDPHLHTHAIVANAAPLAGTWRALHSPLLYAAQRGAGAVYQAVLRHELTRKLGVTWTAVTGGRADVAEVPPAVRRLFSQRRTEVLAEASRGLADRRWAERFTRPEREDLVQVGVLRHAWAAKAGWAPPPLGPGRRPDGADVEPPAFVPDDDRWTRSTLMVALSDHLPDGAPADRLETMAEAALARADVRRLGRQAARQGDERYTTERAAERVAGVSRRLGGPGVPDRPEDLDRLRRDNAPNRVLVVARDDAAAAAIADRAAVLATAVVDADRALDRFGLRSGDVLVISRPERLDSRLLEPVLDHARKLGVAVVGARPVARPLELAVETGPVVTADLRGGSVSVAGTAGAAARQAIADWTAARVAGRGAVLVAERSELAVLAPVARAAVQQAGLVGEGPLARGDVIVFPAGRPSVGVARYDRATIEHVGSAGVQLRLGDGRRLSVSAGWMAGVEQGHVLPPAPQLITGQGDVFVVGGRRFSDRHLAGSRVHHYLTADVGDARVDSIPGGRRTDLSTLDRWLAAVETSPELRTQRRSVQEHQAAAERMRHAQGELRRAQLRGDVPAGRVWTEQRADAERRMAPEGRAPAHGDPLARRDALVVYRALRLEAVVRARERGEPLIANSLDRQVAREEARQAERSAGRVREGRGRDVDTGMFVGR